MRTLAFRPQPPDHILRPSGPRELGMLADAAFLYEDYAGLPTRKPHRPFVDELNFRCSTAVRLASEALSQTPTNPGLYTRLFSDYLTQIGRLNDAIRFVHSDEFAPPGALPFPTKLVEEVEALNSLALTALQKSQSPRPLAVLLNGLESAKLFNRPTNELRFQFLWAGVHVHDPSEARTMVQHWAGDQRTRDAFLESNLVRDPSLSPLWSPLRQDIMNTGGGWKPATS